MIILDTSGLIAAVDRAEELHYRAATVLAAALPPLILSPFVLAEIDYLIARRYRQAFEFSILDEVVRGVYRLEPFSAEDVSEARDVMTSFGALEIGLADASIVVLARRHRATDVLTLDERHFRTLPGPGGRPFRLLPADA